MCRTGEPLYQPVLAYEIEQKGRTEEEIWTGLQRAYDVMRDAVKEGLTGNMTSRSGPAADTRLENSSKASLVGLFFRSRPGGSPRKWVR